jgi:ribosomal protein S18 acetylase RimI-like enzyme
MTKFGSNAAANFTLRPAEESDENFLFHLYANTRQEEMSAWGWNDAQKEAFLRLQFAALKQHHRALDGLDHKIILIDSRPAGRILVMRNEEEIRLSDIALLDRHRMRGIGSRLVRELQEESVETGKPLRLHVERFNRAIRLYERMGFVIIEDKGSHFFMEWARKT